MREEHLRILTHQEREGKEQFWQAEVKNSVLDVKIYVGYSCGLSNMQLGRYMSLESRGELRHKIEMWMHYYYTTPSQSTNTAQTLPIKFKQLNNQHRYFNHLRRSIRFSLFKLVNYAAKSIQLIMLYLNKLGRAYMKTLTSPIIICLLIIIEKFPKHHSLPLALLVFFWFCFALELSISSFLCIYEADIIVQIHKTMLLHF